MALDAACRGDDGGDVDAFAPSWSNLSRSRSSSSVITIRLTDVSMLRCSIMVMLDEEELTIILWYGFGGYTSPESRIYLCCDDVVVRRAKAVNIQYRTKNKMLLLTLWCFYYLSRKRIGKSATNKAEVELSRGYLYESLMREMANGIVMGR